MLRNTVSFRPEAILLLCSLLLLTGCENLLNGGEAPLFTVSYHGNGSSGGEVPVDAAQHEEGEIVTVRNPGDLSLDGYAFFQWNTQADGLGTGYGAGDVFAMPASNVTLYATWTEASPASTSWMFAEFINKVGAGDAAVGDRFGGTAAIDGNTAVVGAYHDDDGGDGSGSVYVLTRSGGVWTQSAKLTADDAAAGDSFGVSVAIDGDTLIVGASGDDDAGDHSGSAYIFTRSRDVWTQSPKLIAEDAAPAAWFGVSVAIDGDTVVVGAFLDNGGIPDGTGSAYVFTRSAGVWSQSAKLLADDAAAGDTFGVSVAIAGDTVVVGAEGDGDGGPYSGSAYVFTRSAGIWSQTAKLTAADAAEDDSLGNPVAIDGDTVVVGARLDDDAGDQSGSAYIFTRSAGAWSQSAKLNAYDAAAGDSFGSRVAIDGDTVIVGATGDDDVGEGSGSAYFFTRFDNGWQAVKLTAADGEAADNFGIAVAIDGDAAIVGAYDDDDGGDSTGSVYFYAQGAAR